MYCYVDESGQHTEGDVFSVAAVIVNTVEARDKVEHMLMKIEGTTGKGSAKWAKTYYPKKVQYLRAIATITDLKGCLFYSIYTDTQDYVSLTVDTIAQAVRRHAIGKYKVRVVIDGLRKRAEQQQIAKRLKQEGVAYKKVRGAKDENSPWIRLADAIAGFSRDAYEGKPYTQNLYSEMQQKRFFIRL